MVYSNSYMFLGIGVFVILSSHALANHLASEPLIYDVYKMPPEPPTYPEINGEALDDQKVDQEYVKAQAKEEALDLNEQKVVEYNAQKIEEALGEQKALEYVTAQKLAACESPPNPLSNSKINEEILDDQKSQEYVKTHKSEEALDEEMVLEYLKAAHKFEALDDHKGQEYVKAHKFAACESPPNPLTGLKINEEALDDQKDQEYVKAQKIAACESPPNPLTDHKINEALDDQKDLEINGKAPKIAAASESSKPLTGVEINESKVDWRSFHAKYPWIKKNAHKSIPGSRKLLNDIANDQLGGHSLQI
ncbi:nodulin-25-like isoform X13 [Trifolium pratense]|uniref:nodulin-25-like isoform X13 n=1 Tax=Trifolium pratense TaxID=57577 RepID=UPI001E692AFC|nr:nodulin-25-like isoform X13 [Trifolium pratense]